MTEIPEIRSEVSDAILTITIDRAAKKNALTTAMYDTLAELLRNANSDPEVRALLLRSQGDVFSAGNDLADFLENPPVDTGSPVFQFLQALTDLEKPIVAAVQGAAVGVGTTMLLHCDIAIASQEATFATPFVDLALVPEAASSLLLPQRIGQQRASAMLMLGDALTARQALEAGLIYAIHSADGLEEAAREIAARLASKPPEALAATRRLLRKDGGAVAERLNEEAALFGERLISEETKGQIAQTLARIGKR